MQIEIVAGCKMQVTHIAHKLTCNLHPATLINLRQIDLVADQKRIGKIRLDTLQKTFCLHAGAEISGPDTIIGFFIRDIDGDR